MEISFYVQKLSDHFDYYTPYKVILLASNVQRRTEMRRFGDKCTLIKRLNFDIVILKWRFAQEILRYDDSVALFHFSPDGHTEPSPNFHGDDELIILRFYSSLPNECVRTSV